MSKLGTRSFLLVLAASLVLGVSGCATVGANEEEDAGVRDPFESFNRSMHAFNDDMDQALVAPVARAYRFLTPREFRNMFRRFVSNLGEPFTAAHQLLQGKPGDSVSDLTRFAINSTLGIGGLFDPATDMGFGASDEDLGQTLAVWGVGPGPYLVLPFLGPSTLRDGTARIAESWTKGTILRRVEDGYILVTIDSLSVINDRADFDPLGMVRERAIDPYIFIREAYMERRVYLIHDGSPPVDTVEDDWTMDLFLDDEVEEDEFDDLLEEGDE